MATRGQIVEGPHTRIELQLTSADTKGELLRFEETYQVGPFSPPLHVHPAQTERFRVLSGRLGVRVGAATKVLEAGESVEVPPGEAHTLWNAGDVPCVHLVELTPARRMEDFFVGIVTLESEGALPPRRLSQAARIARLFLDHDNVVPVPFFDGRPPHLVESAWYAAQRLFFRAVARLGG